MNSNENYHKKHAVFSSFKMYQVFIVFNCSTEDGEKKPIAKELLTNSNKQQFGNFDKLFFKNVF